MTATETATREPDLAMPNPPEAMADVRVRPMRDDDAAAWDAFNSAHADGSFFHRAAWRPIFRDAFGLTPHYLVAERAGRIVGILPLVAQNHFLFGKALIAAPFMVEGGPLAEDAAVDDALDVAALALLDRLGAPALEYRSRRASRPGWVVKSDLYATFAGPISGDDQQNLLRIPRKQRAVVRKALESQTLAGTNDESIDAFFRVYSDSVRNLGTPMFPKNYFRLLRDRFGADCDIVVIRDAGTPVSAVMNFYFKDTVLPYYGGGTVAARRGGANDLLYWEVIRRAAARGYRRFDFGRSKAGTGPFAFKKNWGFEPEFLQYEFYLRPGASLPEKNPNNPKYARFIAAWKKLPLPVANFLGPFLIGGLG